MQISVVTTTCLWQRWPWSWGMQRLELQETNNLTFQSWRTHSLRRSSSPSLSGTTSPSCKMKRPWPLTISTWQWWNRPRRQSDAQRPTNPSGFSPDTWRTIEERRQLKRKALDSKSPNLQERAVAQYWEKDKQVRTSARRDKRLYVERLAAEAEAAAERKDMKTVYLITRKLCVDRGQNQYLTLKAKLERWWKLFQQPLNRYDQPSLTDICVAEQDLDIELGPITVQEAKDAIKKLKYGKEPDNDNVCVEMLKAEEQEMPQLLQNILRDVWDNEVIPDAWKRGTIIKLSKKGNLSECINCRGITLLSITSNVLCCSILQHITTAVEKLLHQEQADFRKGISCIDHIFVPCHILEQSHEWNSSLYMVFVDFEKAYDSLHWPLLWKILLLFFGVHPLRMTTTSSSTLKTQHEEEESMC